MYQVEDVIKFFLAKSAMSHKKLQKLLYYAYCWVLALLNDSLDNLDLRLFDERIEAWVHGPVIPRVYGMYKCFGGTDIPQEKDNLLSPEFSEEVKDILNQVWDVYGKYTGNQLETISHKELPWICARNGIPAYQTSTKRISDTVIFEYYNGQSYEE